jgi:dTDP-4-amino-4,6-dideoxygalactose transaminase
MVPFLDLRIRERELRERIEASVAHVLERGTFILGDELAAFEHEFAEYSGARYAVGVGTGLDALELALRAVGVQAGDEVIVPATTFIATWLAVSRLGAVPVPAEVLGGTALLDPASVRSAITPRTQAIVPVHLYGMPAPMDAILGIAREAGLRVVADAAQAHGARLDGLPLGRYGDAVCYSFYPSKNLGCLGDGGAVVTASAAIADKVRLLRNYGSREKYHHVEIGTNSRLDELQAAILRLKLPYLDGWNARRREIAAAYTDAFAHFGELLELPANTPRAEPVWHLYPVRVAARDALARWLDQAGIGNLIHYPVPPHLQPAYAARRFGGDFRLSESIAGRTLSLPMGPYLDDTGLETVIDALGSFVRGRHHRA